MNITFVLPDDLPISGVVSWSREMAWRLIQRGHQTILIVHNHQATDDGSLDEKGVQIVPCDNKPANEATLSDINRYEKIYQTVLPSIIVPNWSQATYATCASILSKGHKDLIVIGYAHSEIESYFRLLAYYEPIISKFVAVSTQVANQLAKAVPHRKDDILVKAYSVEVASTLTRSYSQETERLRLLYAGRLDESVKRVFDLISLVRLLSGKDIDFVLNIAGDGPVKTALTRAIDGLNSECRKRIKFHGIVDHNLMPALWSENDICVMVSAYEGTSVAMLEAMAQGCVPVVTKVSGTLDVIEHGINGFTVEVGDLVGMAETIAKLANDREQLVQLGNNAHKTILQNYSYDGYLDWFVNMVEDVHLADPRAWNDERPLMSFSTERYSRMIIGFTKRLRLERFIITWRLASRLRKWKQLLWR